MTRDAETGATQAHNEERHQRLGDGREQTLGLQREPAPRPPRFQTTGLHNWREHLSVVLHPLLWSLLVAAPVKNPWALSYGNDISIKWIKT